jgi:hypothetical protein
MRAKHLTVKVTSASLHTRSILLFVLEGVLAVPGASSPQELFDAAAQGARVVKLFPAQMWKPSVLKAVLGVGSLSQLLILPSGGIDADNAACWLQAGAVAVGMGSCLVGPDTKLPPPAPGGDDDVMAQRRLAAQEKWVNEGRQNAASLFKKLANLVL